MISLNFFTDAGLTTPAGGSIVLQTGVSGSADAVLYLGSANAAASYQLASSPGVGQIAVSVGGAGGQGAASVRLATSSAGLGAATGGAPVNVGAEIQGGAAGAIAVHVRVTDSVGIAGSYSGLTLTTNTVIEVV